MAYATATVTGMKNLYDGIITFALANGWVLHDTVNSINDKVLKSTGSSGQRNLIYRLQIEDRLLDVGSVVGTFVVGETITGGTSGNTGLVTVVAPTQLNVVNNTGMFTAAETVTGGTSGATAVVTRRVRYSSIKDPSHIHNAADHLIVRAYNFWDTVGNTGVNEYSRYGYFVWTSPNDSTYTPYYWVPGAVGAKFPLRSNTNDAYHYTPPGAAGGSQIAWNTNHSIQYDGIRRLIGNPAGQQFTNQHTNFDIPSSTCISSAGFPYMIPNQRGKGLISMFDRVNDRWYRYADQRLSSPAPNYWQRWNGDSNAWETAASFNLLFAYSEYYSKLCWDGDKYIYMLNSQSTQFSRYDISTNTWGSLLTACPETADGGSPSASVMFYVPSGTITAVTTDEIWVIVRASATIRRYQVATNTWTSQSIPETPQLDGRSFMMWDYERYFYYYPNFAYTYAYRLDLQNLGAGWISHSVSPYNMQYYSMNVAFNQFTGRIRGRANQPITYWIVGDVDTITVVTMVTGGGGAKNYYWTQFGRCESFYPSTLMTSSGAAGPGAPATVNVDSTTGFAAGQKITAFVPATGLYTPVTINTILSPTSFSAFLTASLPSGTKFSVDNFASLITGDSHFASLANDAQGFFSDGTDLVPSYRINPMIRNDWLPRGGPTVRDSFQVWPFLVFQNFPGLNTYENRGKLRHVFVTRKGTFPNPVSEDIISDGVNQYRVFYPKNYDYTVDNQYLIAIGPIN